MSGGSGAGRDDPLPRPAARVIVFDRERRLLLLRTSLSDDPGAGYYWMTPGGRLDAGEDPRTGAARELFEETGLRAAIGPLVWIREFTWRFPGNDRQASIWFATIEHFFLVLLDEERPPLRPPDGGAEMVHLGEGRWWSVEELRETEEPLSPLALRDLVVPLARGELPPEPLHIGR